MVTWKTYLPLRYFQSNLQERERQACSLSRGSLGTSEAPAKGELVIEEPSGCSNVQSVSQPLLGLPIVTACVKEEKELAAGQEEGKDKFQKAGMFPESMYFLKHPKLLSFVNSAACEEVVVGHCSWFCSSHLQSCTAWIWLPGRGGSL